MGTYNLNYYIGNRKHETCLSNKPYKDCIIKRTVLEKIGAHKIGKFKIERAN